jgi:hypothetical protein
MNGRNPYFLDDSFDKMGDMLEQPDLGIVIEIIEILVTNCGTESMVVHEKRASHLPESEPLYTIPGRLLDQFFDRYVIRDLVECKSAVEAVTAIYSHLVYCDLRRSEDFINELCIMVTNAKMQAGDVSYSLRQLAAIFKLEDGFDKERLDLFLNSEVFRGHMHVGGVKLFQHV